MSKRLGDAAEEVYHVCQAQAEQTRLLRLIAEWMLQDPEEAEEQGQGGEEAVNLTETNADPKEV